MPAFDEEIEAAGQEGIDIQILITPLEIIEENGKLKGVKCIKNELGDVDSSGRRRPVPIEGSEFEIELDTLIVAISEDSGKDCISAIHESGIDTTSWNTIKANARTKMTNKQGVFAAGDVIYGPNTVIDAIADGKLVSETIDRYLQGLPVEMPAKSKLPNIYIEPAVSDMDEVSELPRSDTMRAPAEWRVRNFSEVEVSLSVEEATRESSRCLRCDLEFTHHCKENQVKETEVAIDG